jgi:tol-pal system protein YbgF
MTFSRVEKPLVASFALAITVWSPVFAQSNDPNIAADLVIQIQELQDEVRMLRGRVEEQERELANLKQRQRDQYLDLDQRISGRPEPEPESPAASPPEPVPDTPPQGASATPGVAEDHPEVRAQVDTPSETAALDAPRVSSQAAAAAPEAEKAAYEKAFQALKELRYADAAEDFQAFLDKYPGSAYAGNAQYWLGESYYVTRNYDMALTAFNHLLERYPDSNKVPDALLKIGYTYYELKQWDNARAALTQVQSDYPDTTLARLAENRLRSMRMEGHY